MIRSFLNPTMLAALGGAAVPLVLHLLARARYRNVNWGAMMFLSSRRRGQTHTATLKQWLLLGMRMAIVALIAVALARPLVPGRWGGIAQDSPLTAVIVLDCSYSMAYEEAGRSRFEKAREAAAQVLSSLRKGDEAALVLLGDRIEVREPTANLPLLLRDVGDLAVSNGQADVAAGLARARDVLAAGRANRELYLICDRQAMSWQNVAANLRQLDWIKAPPNPTHFYVVAVGGEESENVAIESVELAAGVAVRNQPAEIDVRIRNYGTSARAGMDLAISDLTPGDWWRPVKTLGVAVPARGSMTVRVPATFDQPGSHVLRAEINAPGLETDNRLDSAVDVVDPIEVLILSGDESGNEARRESFLPKLALAPFQTIRKGTGDPAIVTVKPAEEWPSLNLAKYQVIILADVPQVTSEQARALEQKVYEGGGLLICPGKLSRLDNYNSVLYREGLGLLPAKLDAPTPADGSDATSLASLDAAHPIFRFRRGGDALPPAVFGRYFPATPRVKDARVLAGFTSGKPYLIEGPRGRGRVLLLTSPLTADWNTLPAFSFYLPFLQSAARYACGPPLPPRNLAPHQPLLLTLDEGIDEARLEVLEDPSPSRRAERKAERIEQRLPLASAGTQVRYAQTDRPGIYRLRLEEQAAGRCVARRTLRRPAVARRVGPDIADGAAMEAVSAVAGVHAAGQPGRIARTRHRGRPRWPGALAGAAGRGGGALRDRAGRAAPLGEGGWRMIAALVWRAVELWPVALAVVALLVSSLAFLYPRQVRLAPARWRWAPPALRGLALLALAASILRPSVIRAKNPEEQGTVVVLLDHSLSMGILDRSLEFTGADRSATVAELVALADGLEKILPGARPAAMVKEIHKLSLLGEDIARARRGWSLRGFRARAAGSTGAAGSRGGQLPRDGSKHGAAVQIARAAQRAGEPCQTGHAPENRGPQPLARPAGAAPGARPGGGAALAARHRLRPVPERRARADGL